MKKDGTADLTESKERCYKDESMAKVAMRQQ